MTASQPHGGAYRGGSLVRDWHHAHNLGDADPAGRALANAATAVNPSCSPDATSVILLGASNLARGFPSVLSGLRQGLEGPLHIAVAMGHGRSFGIRSYLFGRALPGILECGLWPHLRSSCGKIRTPLAAIADLGNDLMYGVDVETLLGWLELSLLRLRELNAAVVMLSLPMASLAA